MIKISMKLGIEGKYLDIIKTIYGKPTASIIPNVESSPYNLELDKDVHSHHYYST